MNLSRDELLSQLRQMDEYEFEELVADVWEQRGWETTVTTDSSDRGIDVVAEKDTPFRQKHLIQAKRYSAGNKIGSPDIQQYSSLRRQENDVDAVVVVTTSSFSNQAQRRAKDLNVKLIDGDDLINVISELEVNDFLSDYLEAEENKKSKRVIEISNIISEPLDKNLQDMRKDMTTNKYSVSDNLDIKFLDGNGDPIKLRLTYDSVSSDFVMFRIRIENPNYTLSADLDYLKSLSGVCDIKKSLNGKPIFESEVVDISAERLIISQIIHEINPDFSEQDELYLNENIPENSDDDGLNVSQSDINESHSENKSPEEKYADKINRWEEKFDSSN